jgi:hypothetical protein
MKKPRYELEQYEGKVVVIQAKYEKTARGFSLFFDAQVLGTEINLDHINFKSKYFFKHGKTYTLTGKIIKYQSSEKETGYDWGFENYKVKVEPIKK